MTARWQERSYKRKLRQQRAVNQSIARTWADKHGEREQVKAQLKKDWPELASALDELPASY